MARPTYELADVIDRHLPQLDSTRLPSHHKRTLSALSRCRTAALGGHIDACTKCGHQQISYNSCRNRHCPKCQGLAKEMWIVQQEDMLLPVAYFHVVFTLPHELNELCLHHGKDMYDLLFQAAWHTIKTLSADPKWLGAKSAATMVLHTWSQTLGLHPHVHCIVPNGGLTAQGKWQLPKRGVGNFLYPVKAMQQLYKGYFMDQILDLLKTGQVRFPQEPPKSMYRWKDALYRKDWVVYTKKPFAGVKHVVDYLARYSHRVAITNHRIVDMSDGQVAFHYKDYKKGGTKKIMRLQGQDFLRRFTMHILPHRFRKVRQFGFVSNASKKKSIALARASLAVKQKELLTKAERKRLAKTRLFKHRVHKCPCCQVGELQTITSWLGNKDPPTSDHQLFATYRS